MYLYQTVTRLVQTQINELIEEKMGLGTEIKQNNFKVSVEKFAKHMESDTLEIDYSVKTY